MKIGIKKIEFIPAANCRDWSSLPLGNLLNLASYTDSTPINIPFTPGTGEYSSDDSVSSSGAVSTDTIVATIGSARKGNKTSYQRLTRTNNIYILTLMNGNRIVIGSIGYPAKFRFSSQTAGFSSSGFNINISCSSKNGGYSLLE